MTNIWAKDIAVYRFKKSQTKTHNISKKILLLLCFFNLQYSRISADNGTNLDTYLSSLIELKYQSKIYNNRELDSLSSDIDNIKIEICIKINNWNKL